MLSGDEVSCSRGWPHAFFVTEDDLDLWILCLFRTRITYISYHTQQQQFDFAPETVF